MRDHLREVFEELQRYLSQTKISGTKKEEQYNIHLNQQLSKLCRFWYVKRTLALVPNDNDEEEDGLELTIVDEENPLERTEKTIKSKKLKQRATDDIKVEDKVVAVAGALAA
eukprot:gene31129-38467_t